MTPDEEFLKSMRIMPEVIERTAYAPPTEKRETKNERIARLIKENEVLEEKLAAAAVWDQIFYLIVVVLYFCEILLLVLR